MLEKGREFDKDIKLKHLRKKEREEETKSLAQSESKAYIEENERAWQREKAK